MVADAPTMGSLGKRYGAFGGRGIAAGKVEVLLMVSGLVVDKSGITFIFRFRHRPIQLVVFFL